MVKNMTKAEAQVTEKTLVIAQELNSKKKAKTLDKFKRKRP